MPPPSPPPALADRTSFASRPASRASTTWRSSALSTAVACAMIVARHSDTSPAERAASVCGNSWTSALARPRRRLPRVGDSRRAKAICSAMPTPTLADGTPASRCACRWDRSNSTAMRAWAAAAAALSDSNADSNAIRARSSASVSATVSATVSAGLSEASDIVCTWASDAPTSARREMNSCTSSTASPCMGAPVAIPSFYRTPVLIARVSRGAEEIWDVGGGTVA